MTERQIECLNVLNSLINYQNRDEASWLQGMENISLGYGPELRGFLVEFLSTCKPSELDHVRFNWRNCMMIADNWSPDLVQLKTLKNGDCFRYVNMPDTIYMKISNRDVNNTQNELVCCVDLATGDTRLTPEFELVHVVQRPIDFEKNRLSFDSRNPQIKEI